ncbi:MAG: L,D-transpeptidase [Saprospiraceae bacterium]|nr:L,D-transpeptidase [Saprospiraceae bacterium]
MFKTINIIIISFIFISSCKQTIEQPDLSQGSAEMPGLIIKTEKLQAPFDTIIMPFDVSMSCYFDYLDSLVSEYDSLVSYPISEHLIVRANPWIIDTLVNTDYYIMMEHDSFVYDQRDLIILKKGDTIYIPNEKKALEMLDYQQQIVLDLNIPEYKLRIWDGTDTLYTFLVRVGRNERKYLAMSGHTTDLRTKPGIGKIIRLNRNPTFINPADNKPFTHTRRDDGKTTIMPLIPWIEPEIDGHRYGHLIHPTTNPKTLGRAYSNGCIGTREGDMWQIYYYAPIGTKVVFRYDLNIINEEGDTIRLKDIYGWGKSRKN